MSVLTIIGILIVLIFVFIWLSYVRANSNIRSLIKTLRENEATNITTSKTAEELNLKLGSTIGNFNLLRDYKPYSLQMLIDEGIIQVTEDGKLFLSEEKLALSRWSQN